MPTSYRYCYSPKGVGYNVWVTKQTSAKRKPTYRKKSDGLLVDLIAEVGAAALKSYFRSGSKKRYR